jgi:hypothetical protein
MPQCGVQFCLRLIACIRERSEPEISKLSKRRADSDRGINIVSVGNSKSTPYPREAHFCFLILESARLGTLHRVCTKGWTSYIKVLVIQWSNGDKWLWWFNGDSLAFLIYGDSSVICECGTGTNGNNYRDDSVAPLVTIVPLEPMLILIHWNQWR